MLRSIYATNKLVLLRLFNACARLGYFPGKWKQAEVVFFVKKGKDVSQSAAYRPICLLPVFSNVLEKLIKMRVVHDLENADFLHKAQFGFRENRSTESAVLAAAAHVKKEVKNDAYPVLVSLDIQGAFDSVGWDTVLDSLTNSPLDRNILPLIRSYLCNRRVSFFYGNTLQTYQVSKGCPQGSVLGPLFWNLVADQILKEINQVSKFIAFADDFLLMKSTTSRRQLEVRVNRALGAFKVACSRRNHLGKVRV